jgi:dextranase
VCKPSEIIAYLKHLNWQLPCILCVAYLAESPQPLFAQGPLVYGYLSSYPSQSAITSSNEVAWLHRYHVNYVQFYDWQWKHHVPLAGTSASPSGSWNDIANHANYRQTVNDFISACHANGMKAMAYNLLYGAYADYATDGSGVNAQWALYNTAGGTQWSVALPGGWATPALMMFNPGNTLWQSYLFSRMNDLFSAYAFDGWHVDQLGDPGGLKFDSNGNPIDVWQTFANFLNTARSATGKGIIFNNVGAYGLFSSINQTANDDVYVECWESSGQVTYNDLKTVIDEGLAWGNGKPVVLAAYINRGKTSGSFNTPGVLLCDAAIFANGGTHLELGDGGHMLDNEYFPNATLTLSASLANTLTNYYNFIVSYQNWLYGGLANSTNAVSLSVPAATMAMTNHVWAFAKSAGATNMINLINLVGEDNISWRDNVGSYPAPIPQTNIAVKYYYGLGGIRSVQTASPDINDGSASNLNFTLGTDAGGNYVAFVLPNLIYWDLIMIQSGPPPSPRLLAPQWSRTNFSFGLATMAGQSYTVWGKTNLISTNWFSQTNFVGNGSTNQVWLPLTGQEPSQFYRISLP